MLRDAAYKLCVVYARVHHGAIGRVDAEAVGAEVPHLMIGRALVGRRDRRREEEEEASAEHGSQCARAMPMAS